MSAHTFHSLLRQLQTLKVNFKDFSRRWSDFPVPRPFKADLIFKDFSRNPPVFKYMYFSSLCNLVIAYEKIQTHFLNISMLGKFSSFCCYQLAFFKINFFNTIRLSNSFDPDQDVQSIGPDLDQNCLKGNISK